MHKLHFRVFFFLGSACACFKMRYSSTFLTFLVPMILGWEGVLYDSGKSNIFGTIFILCTEVPPPSDSTTWESSHSPPSFPLPNKLAELKNSHGSLKMPAPNILTYTQIFPDFFGTDMQHSQESQVSPGHITPKISRRRFLDTYSDLKYLNADP